MFLEHKANHKKRTGCTESVCGSMFSNEAEGFIRCLRRARTAYMKVEIFKSASNVHCNKIPIVSHNKNSIASTPVKSRTVFKEIKQSKSE
jgi:thymidine kinase